MARVKNPFSFSSQFGVPKTILRAGGALDPVLNVDTRLFIDPLLLSASGHLEMRQAAKRFNEYFTTIIKLLSKSKGQNDAGWRAAARMLKFPEIPGTCLGYGRNSIKGSAFGPDLTGALLKTTKEVVDLGVSDPELFLALSVFEGGIGPDRISDMTTNIIVPNLAEYTRRVLASCGLSFSKISVGQNEEMLLANPLDPNGSPVFLVPKDVLRELPIATDWDDVSAAAAHNERLRQGLNNHLADLWETQSLEAKRALRSHVFQSKKNFEELLQAMRDVPKVPYDFEDDPGGFFVWARHIKSLPKDAPLDLSRFGKRLLSIDEVHSVATAIVEHFKTLVEDKGLWKELWSSTKRRPEKSAQRLFFAIADSYCSANNLDISPESDSGAGPVDFKVSAGYEARVVVELKLSDNSKVVSAYTAQLGAYRRAESTDRGLYVVIDIGGLGEKDVGLHKLRNEQVLAGHPASDLFFIDGKRQVSASKRS